MMRYILSSLVWGLGVVRRNQQLHNTQMIRNHYVLDFCRVFIISRINCRLASRHFPTNQISSQAFVPAPLVINGHNMLSFAMKVKYHVTGAEWLSEELICLILNLSDPFGMYTWYVYQLGCHFGWCQCCRHQCKISTVRTGRVPIAFCIHLIGFCLR